MNDAKEGIPHRELRAGSGSSLYAAGRRGDIRTEYRFTGEGGDRGGSSDRVQPGVGTIDARASAVRYGRGGRRDCAAAFGCGQTLTKSLRPGLKRGAGEAG